MFDAFKILCFDLIVNQAVLALLSRNYPMHDRIVKIGCHDHHLFVQLFTA